MFDAMANAVDWFDAYRARDIEAILDMYSADALVECRCGGEKSLGGRDALRAYWVKRLIDYVPSHLYDIKPASNGVTLSYVAAHGAVHATLEFDSAGKIAVLRCGPSLTPAI